MGYEIIVKEFNLKRISINYIITNPQTNSSMDITGNINGTTGMGLIVSLQEGSKINFDNIKNETKLKKMLGIN